MGPVIQGQAKAAAHAAKWEKNWPERISTLRCGLSSVIVVVMTTQSLPPHCLPKPAFVHALGHWQCCWPHCVSESAYLEWRLRAGRELDA